MGGGFEMNERPETFASRPCGASRRTVLLVDDEPLVRRALARALHRHDVHVLEAGDAMEAIARLEACPVDLVIADHRMPGEAGVDLLAGIRERWPKVGRVLITGFEDSRVAREAINRAGISYFLSKPWDSEGIAHVVKALSHASHPGRATTAKLPTPSWRKLFPEIVGESKAIRELLELVWKVADTDSTALITGETGTGKELIGRALHHASRRKEKVFCAVNSAAFPETLLESELFGHRRGAFTGASANSKGLFEQADKGTVFLDEVAEMPLSMQAKLLRFLQTGEIRPVGGESTRYVDVRLVTATNKSLEEEVKASTFREDLYYRLAVIPIHVPALRERPEDVPLLARHFLEKMCRKAGRELAEIEDGTLQRLVAHRWPGNVRELENVIERAVALCAGGRITPEDLPRQLLEQPAASASEAIQSLPGMERKHILATLDRVGWNRKQAASLLQISTTTLWRRLKEFGIDGDPRRSSNHAVLGTHA